MKFVAATRLILYIDDEEIDVVFRKKLFRAEAAASPGLGEKHELIGRKAHLLSQGPGSRSVYSSIESIVMRWHV